VNGGEAAELLLTAAEKQSFSAHRAAKPKPKSKPNFRFQISNFKTKNLKPET